LPTVALFFVWDAIAVARDIWQYNPRYVCALRTFESARGVTGR